MQQRTGSKAPPKPGRVSLPVVPPRGSPFEGISGTNAPARNTRIPNLTERVAEAKTRKQALTHGGLTTLTPAQHKAASDAGKALAAHKFLKRAAQTTPKPSARTPQGVPTPQKPLTLGAPAPPPRAPSPAPPSPTSSPGRRGALINPRLQAVAAQPGQSSFDLGSYLRGPAIGREAGGAVQSALQSFNHPLIANRYGNKGIGAAARAIAPATRAADYAVGTAAEVAKAIPGTFLTPPRLGDTHTPIQDVRPTSAAQAGANIQGIGAHLPTTIPSFDLVGTAKASGKTYTPQELVAAGLVDHAQDARFTKLALKRGWTRTELDNLVGLDKIKRAYSNPPPEPLRTFQNAAGGVVASASIVNAVPAFLSEVASGHGSRAATQLGGALTSRLPVVGQHPLGEMVLGDPYNTLAVLAGGVKTAGGIGGKLGELTGARIPGERNVTLAGSNIPVSRGPQARNLYNAAGQSIADTAASKLAPVGNRVLAKQLDRIYADQTNAIAPGHFTAAREFAQARKQIGNERSVIIMKAQEAGAFHHDGTISHEHLQSQLHDWEAKAKIDGPNSPAAGQAAFFRDKVIPGLEHVTPEDIAFAKAHSDLAAHNTESRQGQGQGFDSTAALYRQHERLLTAAARQGDLNPALGNDPLAVKVLQLRKEYQNSSDSAAGQALGREGGKLAEAQRLARQADAKVSELQATLGTGRRASPASRALGAKLDDAQAQAADLHARIADLSQKVGDKSAAQFEAQHANIAQRYQQAMQEFAAQHANEGGALPVRAEYTMPPSSTGYVPPAQRTGGGKFNDNPQGARIKASTGYSAETGRYLTDPQAPLRESMRARNLAISAGAARQTFHDLGHEVPAGTSVPRGWVFVPEHNAATAGKLINELHDNPVNADEWTQQATMRQSLSDHLFNGHQTAGEVTATNGHMLPEAVFNRVQDYSRPESRGPFAKSMAQYQRWLIGTFPSTVLGNTLGTVPLGMAGGAFGRDYKAALQFPTESTPFTTHSGTVSGRLQAPATNAATKFNQFMLGISRRGEAVTAKALWIHGMGGTKGMTKRSAELGYKTVHDYAKDVSLGKVDKAKRDAALDWSTKFVGDSLTPDGKIGRFVANKILFHKWVEHMARLMLYTLPVKHPRRLALINALAQYGDAYRKEHGVWPSYMQAFFPLFAEKMGLNQITTALNLGQFAPQNTAGGTVSGLFDNSTPWYQRALGLAAPWYGIPLKVGVQSIQNKGSYNPVNLPWYMAHLGLGAVPGSTKFATNAGRGPEYVPFIHDTKTTTSYVNADGQTVKIPVNQRSGGRPLGADSPFWSLAALAGIASRVGGVPIEQIPSGGQYQRRDITTTEQRATKDLAKTLPKRPY